MKHSVVCTAILLVLWLLPVQAIEPHLLQKADPQKMEQWTDSVFNTLSPAERTAQLFVITVRNSDTPQNRQSLRRLVRELKVGGLLFDSGSVQDQAALTNYCQALSKVPLLMTLDGEWGLAMRLTDTPKFPFNMTLGAVQNDSLLYEYGRAVGRQCRRMGIQVNFAPVLDINSNPANPVIGKRSFGQTLDNVSAKGIAYARGLEAEGVLSVAKHFPGHDPSRLRVESQYRNKTALRHILEIIQESAQFIFHSPENLKDLVAKKPIPCAKCFHT